MPTADGSLFALIYAPHGRDAAIAGALLSEAGIAARIPEDIAGLANSLTEEAGFVVTTIEAIRQADLRALAGALAAQPPWSDIPVILLTQRGGGPERNPEASRLSEVLGNASFLERPFHATTFISVAKAALKTRQRQFEARARIEEIREAQAALREANDMLEQRVAERTAELQRAHRQRIAEAEQRERAEALLHQAQKMEMIGQLTGGVAHDFNNLLMAVMGNLELLRKRLPSDARTNRLLEGAVEGAQRGAALTQRLLAFARRQDLDVKPRNINTLVRGMADLLERSAGSRVQLHYNLDESAPWAAVDVNQVELALMNLVVNARDAMPDGGDVAIGVETVEERSSDDLSPGRYVRLQVKDTGVGMDAATLAKATEPFFSTKAVGKGTGLGLSMIQGLAVQLGGALRLTSEAGAGATASLLLPTTEKPAEAASPVIVEPTPASPIPTLQILVVDDDALVGMSTVHMLEDLGHEAMGCSSGEEALACLRSGARLDLMITDYAMPQMTGLELARAARTIRPDLPVLLASGFADVPERDVLDLPRIAKPYMQAQLHAAISSMLLTFCNTDGFRVF